MAGSNGTTGAGGGGAVGVAGSGNQPIAVSSIPTPGTLTNVCRRTPAAISHRVCDGKPRRTVPSLGLASSRPPASEARVLASTATAPGQLLSTAQLDSWTGAWPATR